MIMKETEQSVKLDNASNISITCFNTGRCSKLLRILTFMMTNAIYVSIGAFGFSALEREHEEAMCALAKHEFKNFTDSLTHTDDGRHIVSNEELLRLIREVEELSSYGLSVADFNKTGCPDLWDYTGALYFCLTIGTTIGYGDTAPSTVNGRLLFIFYVIPGICVCGAMIGEIGILIYEQLQRGKRMYQLKFKHVWIYWTLNSIFGFAFFWLVPAAIIDAFATDWNFFEAVYFSMVTVTTVGFGDLTITDHNAKFLVLAFNYLGLAWIGMLSGVAIEKIQEANKVSVAYKEDDEDSLMKIKVEQSLGKVCTCQAVREKNQS